MLKIRASQLGLIMTDAQSIDKSLLSKDLLEISEKKKKTDEDKELLAPYLAKTLSIGAKTYIKKLAKEFVFGYYEQISSKYTDKGIQVEDESIALYNRVFLTDYTKNKERKDNEFLTGECDIFTGSKIIDVKSSWSLGTFPCFKEDAEDKLYEWQLRGYMMLWECNEAELAYCMVNTPDDLIRYEQIDMHIVDGIDENLRVTVNSYKRDLDLEENIKVKCKAAQNYFNELLEQMANDHKY